MRRRDFITLIGSAAATVARPVATRAQQASIPVVGFLNSQSAQGYERQVAAFLEGLAGAGYVDGRNVKIEFRWAENQYDRFPAMIADLMGKKVAVIAATSTPAALAVKAANIKIPTVFETSLDPVQLGLVANLNRPGENITGVTQQSGVLTPKRLEVLHEFVPAAKVIGLLVNPANPLMTDSDINTARSAAKSLNITLQVLNASSEHDFDNEFAKLAQLGAGGLVIGSDPLFTGQYVLLAESAARYAMPTVFANRRFAAAGGLASYSGNIIDSYRLTGVYVARILKGEKPADLPVQHGTKFELFINAKAAKELGITIPIPLSGLADEIIE